MLNRSRGFAVMAAVAFAALPIAPAAFAQSSVQEVVVTTTHPTAPGAERRRQVVSYADLDLSNDAGATVMLQRIRSAAKTVCSPEPTGLAEQSAYKACFASSMTGALSRLNNAKVTALAAAGS
jgi:UrcA family protein